MLQDYLVAYYDKQARVGLQDSLDSSGDSMPESAMREDYSKLRSEVLESLYPADQLLALYMVQKAQDGDYESAHRIVEAYSPEWRAKATEWGEKFENVDPARTIEDIIYYTHNICIGALMGHNLQAVEVGRSSAQPFSMEDLATLLNPKKLKERLEFNEREGPLRTSLAVFIYLTNRIVGREPDNSKPFPLDYDWGTTLPSAFTGPFDLILENCANILLFESLPGVHTAEDPQVNSNRFNPAKAKWNLRSFFRTVVDHRLRDIYEREYTYEKEGKRITNDVKVPERLDKEITDKEGEHQPFGHTLESRGLQVEEEVERILFGHPIA